MSAQISKTVIVVGAVALCTLVAVVVVAPDFHRARTDVSRNPCINILRHIDGATETWAFENGKTSNDIPTWEDIRHYFSPDGRIPKCPQGGKYTLGRKGTPPTCSVPGHRLP
jgi:hypothetical protein